MKKTLLMFVGLAMCSTIAFGQANNYNAKISAKDLNKMTVSTKIEPRVDYKASIFAKDGNMDTIKTWTFDGTNQNMPTVYGTDGYVSASMTVAGEALEANGATNECSAWQHVYDSSFFESQFFEDNYTLPASWIEYILEDLEGGCMLSSYRGLNNSNSGRPHAYMDFAPVARPANAQVILVSFLQVTPKYYNQYFIDYKVGGAWQTYEINVEGVDADINTWCTYNPIYTMPLTFANESQLNIRIRTLGANIAGATSSRGYFWAIDNVSLIAGPVDNWSAYGDDFVDGFYGTMPQGMNIPMTWMAYINNMGANDRNNVNAVARHISTTGDTTLIISTPAANLPAGNATISQPVLINERGVLDPTNEESMTYPGWWSYTVPGLTGSNGVPSGFMGRGLPTSVTGQNKVQTRVTSTGIDPLNRSLISYRVVGMTDPENGNNNLIEGYRWAHDNGIITSGTHRYNNTYSSSFTLGKVIEGEGENAHAYVSDSGNFGSNGYYVLLRYNTPSVVPTDDNGHPWVLRGMEVVTSTEFDVEALDGTQLAPLCFTDEYDGDNMGLAGVNTGVNNQIFEFDGESLFNNAATGIIVANENADYHAASFFFPEQPELTPNTSFRLGYQVVGSAQFAAAATNTRYIDLDSVDEPILVSVDSIAPGYARNFPLNTYDMLVHDNEVGGGNLWGAGYTTQVPMIRAIIGPKLDLPTHSIFVQCDPQASVQLVDVEKCGEEVLVAQGSAPTFYFFAADSHYVLKQLTIDGRVIVPATEDDINGDPNFYTEGNDDIMLEDYEYPLLERNYWTYTFESDDLNDHTISVTTEYAEWNFNAIDPVAADVTMLLAPNPATSQVAMTLKGVTGMVNCNIIDMSGRVIYNNVLNAERSNSIDLSNVPAGAYFVRISNDSFVKVEKLIVR